MYLVCFKALMIFNNDCASLFLFIAASEISSFARSTSSSIPHPTAQHFASITIASGSPRVTHSSRSATAFAFFSSCFSSRSIFASSLFDFTCIWLTGPSESSTHCVLALFFGGICVDWKVLRVIWSFRETKKGEINQKKMWISFYCFSQELFCCFLFLFLITPLE